MQRLIALLAGTLVLTLESAVAHAGGWHAVAFMYHRFGEDQYPATNVTLEQFEAHLDYLGEEGYTVWPIERIVDHMQSGGNVPDRTVAITIDDAYRSVYDNAYPILKERELPFSVFVATDPIDEGLSGYMTWEQMREMQEHGATFANHSATHDYLVRRENGESDEDYRTRVREDLLRARARLDEELDAERIVDLFAYPYGEYNAVVAAVAADLGYVSLGQQSGAIGPYSDARALPRFPMAENYAAIDEFSEKARSKGLPVAEMEPWDPELADGTPPRMTVQLGESEARLDQLACFVSRQGQVDVEWIDREARIFAVQAPEELPTGRTRYNCTAPSPEAGRFYWLSQQWVLPPAAD
ncbi:peptidoglycan/xylan/chitin deacetylase (PgdA/CDA1 family) [Natronocella acetinitrilica]|uniref:Peptidoglycan/xylan/chitin deacetylase (PgdA/CDA1 family) n=1 Tax=Natronocella acetinitrilica TaxID=414046 RepID=A0AAE3G5M4_9GAMM|nr:polysaccharide deacetylase family protein [Natronocella acetinitrilica]MCP1676345.1 peptidoglycan/xylan/chitin deacetylase (PgdA/CDA1 family) [Natronocella acetinitrilica]